MIDVLAPVAAGVAAGICLGAGAVIGPPLISLLVDDGLSGNRAAISVHLRWLRRASALVAAALAISITLFLIVGWPTGWTALAAVLAGGATWIAVGNFMAGRYYAQISHADPRYRTEQ